MEYSFSEGWTASTTMVVRNGHQRSVSHAATRLLREPFHILKFQSTQHSGITYNVIHMRKYNKNTLLACEETTPSPPPFRRQPYLHNPREIACLLLPSAGPYAETGSVGCFPLPAPLPFLLDCFTVAAAKGHNQEAAVKAAYLASIKCIQNFRTGSFGGRSASSGDTKLMNEAACHGPP